MIYEKINKICKSKGITVGKLEKDLAFSNATIRKWKKSIPTADKLKAVADYFKVPMEQLLENTEDEEDE